MDSCPPDPSVPAPPHASTCPPSRATHQSDPLPVVHPSSISAPRSAPAFDPLFARPAPAGVREIQSRLDVWKSSLNIGDFWTRLGSTNDPDAMEKQALNALLRVCSDRLDSGKLEDYLNVSAQWRQLKTALTSPDVQAIENGYIQTLGELSCCSEPLLLMPLIAERDRFNKLYSFIARAEALLEQQLGSWRSSGRPGVRVKLRKVCRPRLKSAFALISVYKQLGTMQKDIQGRRTPITPDGYGKFSPGQWLNDDAINYHLELLNCGAEERDAIILPTFFYKKCGEGDTWIKDHSSVYGELKVSSVTCLCGGDPLIKSLPESGAKAKDALEKDHCTLQPQ